MEEFEGPKYMRIAHVKSLIKEGVLGENLRWNDGNRKAQAA